MTNRVLKVIAVMLNLLSGTIVLKDAAYGQHIKNFLSSYELVPVEDEEIRNLRNDIYDKYEINVLIGGDVSEGYTKGNFTFVTEVNKSNVIKTLNLLDDKLSKLNDEALKQFPKQVFVVGQILGVTDGKANIVYGYVLEYPTNALTGKMDKFMVLNSSAWDYTPSHVLDAVYDHEFLHVYDSLLTKKEMRVYRNIKEECSEISSYACTNEYEEMAEAWITPTSMKGAYLHSKLDAKIFK